MRWVLFFSSVVSLVAQQSGLTQSADELMAGHRYTEAEAALSELLKATPGAPRLLLKRGAIRMALGRYLEARADLEAASAAEPSGGSLATAYAQLGILDHIEGRYAKAVHNLRIALELNQETYGPQNPATGVTWSRLGEAYLAFGSPDMADEALSTAVSILNGSPGYEFHLCLAHTNAGRVHLLQRRYAAAAQSFDDARESNRTENGCTPLIASGSGELYSIQKDYAKAEASFRESIQSGRRIWPNGHPTTAGALQLLARTIAARKELGEAGKLLQQAIDMDERVLGPTHPDVRELLLDLAAVLRTAHRGREARLVAARIARDFPGTLHTVSLDVLAGR
jgi:tetratricopeptide (TPR) repeat protein